jgi:hypothetical protein
MITLPKIQDVRESRGKEKGWILSRFVSQSFHFMADWLEKQNKLLSTKLFCICFPLGDYGVFTILSLLRYLQVEDSKSFKGSSSGIYSYKTYAIAVPNIGMSIFHRYFWT